MVAPGVGFEPTRPRKATGYVAMAQSPGLLPTELGYPGTA